MNEYQLYLDMVKEYLVGAKKRLLTEKEEGIVTAHLKVVSATYCNNHYHEMRLGNNIKKNPYEGLSITQVLAVETAKKVSELHPDFPMPTEVEVGQRVKEVVAVQQYLHTNTPEKNDDMFEKKCS